MQPTRWRHSSTHLGIAAAVLALAAAAVVVAVVVLPDESGAGARVVPPAPVATAKPGVVPVSDDAPVPVGSALAAALAPALADPNLGRLTGRITDAVTGKALWTQQEDLPVQPASTNKVLTAAAALLTLDRDERVTTKVVAAESGPSVRAGTVVLVGGGDPTLSAAPPGTETWYPGAARIADLAAQVRSGGVKPTAVLVDTSLFSGPEMAPGWDPADIAGGDFAPIQPVMLDGGRTQPVSVESPRSLTPALDAGRALAVALGVDPATVTTAPGPATGDELASVQSAPLIERLRQMMSASDNVMAESIAREVAGHDQRPRSFAGAVQAVTDRLSRAGVEMTGATLYDSSGLSVLDRLTATNLDEVVSLAETQLASESLTPKTVARYARLVSVAGRPDLAVTQYRTLMQSSPLRETDKIGMITALIDAGHIAEARKMISALKDRPAMKPVKMKLNADIELAEGRAERAIDIYKAACELAEVDGLEEAEGGQATTAEHAELNEKLSELNRKKRNMRARLEDNEEEIEERRRALIDDIKRRSQAQCELIELFTVEWEVI